ncbi:MAG: fused MFS/spermidine synthase [Desulfurococcales archaeon]|nr:fused MFS/spermidine synthase [Desulfurococcales archaeon]
MSGDPQFFSRWSWFIEWMTPSRATLKWVKRVIYQARSKFQDIAVVEVDGEGKVLVIDGKTQSSMLDEHVYHEALVHPAMLLHGEPRRVLILGGGEGATLREALRYKTVNEAVMVDIDEVMVEVAKKYLKEWHQGAFDDPRAKLVISDAWDYVEKALSEGERFDVVIADLVDPEPGGPATKLYTREFYEKVKNILTSGGVFVTQATSISYTIEVHASIRKTLESVFGEGMVASYGVYVPSFDSYWGFAIASKGESPNVLMDRRIFEERYGKLLSGVELKFLDYDSLIHAFTLPKPYREGIRASGRVSTLENPITMPA